MSLAVVPSTIEKIKRSQRRRQRAKIPRRKSPCKTIRIEIFYIKKSTFTPQTRPKGNFCVDSSDKAKNFEGSRIRFKKQYKGE